ncbi:MAG: glycosyltransferase family 2 protein [Bdellovibrio sp.]|nr:glycosyltransferase family 2 protein [Bdellovibrio sp.]
MMLQEIPVISVIMPVYNSETTLKQAVRSVLNQSHRNFELIAVEDGSTDHSWTLLQKLAAEDSRIRAFRSHNNLGVMKTLNYAISLAKTNLLARFDSDDEMRPTSTEEIHARLLIENPMCHSSVMIRKEALEQVGGYRDEFRNSEDYDLWLRISRNYKLANIPESLIRVRLSMGGNSIAYRHQMRTFYELAKASYLQPDQSLTELKVQIEAQAKPVNDQNYLRASFWELTKSLIALGLYADSVKAFKSFLKVASA